MQFYRFYLQIYSWLQFEPPILEISDFDENDMKIDTISAKAAR